MEQIWWERVPNAMLFISDIVSNLIGEKSIILSCSGNFPWYSFMQASIKDIVKQQNSSRRFESISDVDDPGSYLLRKFCKQEKRASYRPTKTYARFLAESDDIVLHERYLWVKIRNKKHLDNWTQFVSDYLRERGKNKAVAVFILEWTGTESISSKKGITSCSFDAYVSEYDRIVFCTLAASSVKERTFIKNYLTELASNIIGNDIELCAACLRNYSEFMQNPFTTINRVLREEIRSDGNPHSFEKSDVETSHLIWLAQIKSIYPVIEQFREDFVHHHFAAISKQLPINSSYGEEYNEPNDVELGTLKYMADNGRLVLLQKEYERLKTYKEARNRLSHLTPLTLDEIKELGV